jgi:osmotically-inducible protein OsmY
MRCRLRFAPALVAAAMLAAAAACTAGPARTPEQVQADSDTAARVYAALKGDRLHYYPALEVQVRGGIAYLTGLTFDGADFDAATDIARHVPGVSAVANSIAVVAGR